MTFSDTMRKLRELRNEAWAKGGEMGDMGDKIEDLMNEMHTAEMERIANM